MTVGYQLEMLASCKQAEDPVRTSSMDDEAIVFVMRYNHTPFVKTFANLFTVLSEGNGG
jgi:hypothetical protein